MSPNNDRFRVLRRLPEIKFEDELRGYSKSQVDRVLETLAPLADEVDELLTRLSQAETRAASAEARLVQQGPTPDAAAETLVADVSVESAVTEPPPDFDETLRKTLLLAQTTADETVRNAKAEAEQAIADANDEAESLRSSARQETDDIHAENKRTRTALHDEVATERVRLLEEAQEEARTRLASLEQELASAHGAERDRLLAEIEELQQTRDQLRGDVELLEGHLAHRRGQLRTALTEMTEALDDPVKLRGSTGPDLSDPAPVASDDYQSVSLAEDSISTLSEDVTPDPTVSPSTFASDSAADGESSTDSATSDEAVGDDVDPSDAEGNASGADDTFGAGDVSGYEAPSSDDDAPAVDVSDSDDSSDEGTDAEASEAGDASEETDTADATVAADESDTEDGEQGELALDDAAVAEAATLEGPEGEWVDDQFGLVGLDDAGDTAEGHPAPPAPPEEAQPAAGPATTETPSALPRRTSTTRSQDRSHDRRLQELQAEPPATTGGWLSDGEGADNVSWDESVPTGEMPAVSEIPDVPPPPAGATTEVGDGPIPDQPAPPPPTQRPADIAAERERPAWADAGQNSDEELRPATAGSSDPFLDELRRVTDEEVDEDDALGRFLNDDEGAQNRGGWFGRRGK